MTGGHGLPASSRSMEFEDFELDSGVVLPVVTVGFNVYGRLNATRNNCVIVGHSLTSNSCIHEWWAELLGDGPHFALDTSRFFVICANYLGSVYGSSGPLSSNPATGSPYMASFPITSIKDNVRLQRKLLGRLDVRGVDIAIGGSLGAMLVLQWASTYPEFVGRAIAIAGCAAHP